MTGQSTAMKSIRCHGSPQLNQGKQKKVYIRYVICNYAGIAENGHFFVRKFISIDLYIQFPVQYSNRQEFYFAPQAPGHQTVRKKALFMLSKNP